MHKKGFDSRIKDRYVSIKVFIRIFILSLVFISFNMWLYQYFMQYSIFEQNKQVRINILIIYITIFSMLSTLFIGFFRYKVRLPIEKLSNAAREIKKGNLSVHVSYLRKDGKKDLVSVLFDDFNSMTEELAYVNNNLQNLVSEKTEKVVKLQNAILKTMSDLVEFRDDITGEHIERTKDGVKILLDEIKRQGLFPEIINNWNINLII